MKKYFITLILSALSTVVSADSRLKYIEDKCGRAYSRADALIQFLYKFDGNLPKIKETKIKNMEFLISQVVDLGISDSVRRKAFGELYNDPDYYQFKIQEKSNNLIKELEEFRSNSSPSKDKNLIFLLPKVPNFGDYRNPYLKIKKLVRINNNARDFFDELESSKTRLEELNMQHRLSKSLEGDPQVLAYTIGIIKNSIAGVVECNLSLLEAKRTFK